MTAGPIVLLDCAARCRRGQKIDVHVYVSFLFIYSQCYSFLFILVRHLHTIHTFFKII